MDYIFIKSASEESEFKKVLNKGLINSTVKTVLTDWHKQKHQD